jgi:hypothetical protein
MPLAGKGMLLTSMDIDPADDEEDFNRWYDREHLEERVAIDGFLEARRYLAHAGSPKYLCLYSTRTIDGSRKTMAKFKNMIRAVGRITISRGNGRGAVLGVVRLRPETGQENALRGALNAKLDPGNLDGIISMHLIESDTKLSGPTTEIPAAGTGAADWFVLIDGTNVSAITTTLAARFTGTVAPAGAQFISSGIYDLMWDLAKSDIP